MFMDNLAKQNACQAMELKNLQHNWRQADEQASISDNTRVDRVVTWHKPYLPPVPLTKCCSFLQILSYLPTKRNNGNCVVLH